jgi:hypothetical protein
MMKAQNRTIRDGRNLRRKPEEHSPGKSGKRLSPDMGRSRDRGALQTDL